MLFIPWIIQLSHDAARHGCSGRFKRSCDLAVWVQVWGQGVQPTIAAVLSWATQSPARFENLRQTEPGLIEKVLANEWDREQGQMAA
jgi:hypothetical protein